MADTGNSWNACFGQFALQDDESWPALRIGILSFTWRGHAGATGDLIPYPTPSSTGASAQQRPSIQPLSRPSNRKKESDSMLRDLARVSAALVLAADHGLVQS
ncbi:hypothetical protein B0H65DRAFT_480598 [Neurospora tetraspora]|uniref:Uncharacterized protein n=1 Tax=Neurospora tetraspora TaxID=94610 RepID=A0AAE0MKG1_9PEZI|nr:hypothetical protein B0H65DRAFT_480598 [Neurospora tetraspora]